MFVIIPAKPFEQSKVRLTPVLSVEQRVALSRQLLLRTIHLARQVGKVVVVSQSKSVRQLAKQAGAWALVETDMGLNAAVGQASHWAALRGVKSVLVLPTDLPLLTLADLREIVSLGQTAPAVVIAPCHCASGTNALFLNPPNLIKFAFGPNSFERHQKAAQDFGIEPTIYRSPTIALDLDYPKDLEKISVNALFSESRGQIQRFDDSE